MSAESRRAADERLFAKIDAVLSGHETQRTTEPAMVTVQVGYVATNGEWLRASEDDS